MNSNINKYNDIINLSHHVSKKHPQMSLEARSAQFAPFSALTGYEDIIEETARLTFERKEIDEEMKISINEKLQEIINKINMKPIATFTYYVPDSQKEGGYYRTVTSKVVKIDKYKQLVYLENNIEIPINEIVDLFLGTG